MSDLKEGDQQSIVHLKPPEDPSICKVLSNNTANKISLDFISNQLTLGNFRAGCEFGNQELLIDAILEGCEFFGVNISHTYKQAMKSNEEKAWRADIEEELTNLRSMEVWTPAKLPPNKLALDGGGCLHGSPIQMGIRTGSKHGLWLRASALGAKLARIRGLSPSRQPHWAGIRPN
jgi:hypothetical protein